MAFDPISAVFEVGGKLIDRLWPDPVQAANAKLELAKLQASGELQIIAGQLEVNKAEASNSSLFVAGWRPFIGWVCGIGLTMQFLVAPLIVWIGAIFHYVITLPPMDMGVLVTMLGGMLGLGGLRTIEKVNGAARNSMKE